MSRLRRWLNAWLFAAPLARRQLVPYRGLLLASVDVFAWAFGFVATARISLGPAGGSTTVQSLIIFFVVITITQLVVGRSLGLYRGRFRVGGYDEAVAIGLTWVAVLVATTLLELLISRDGWLPETPTLFRSSVALTGMVVVRFLWRLALEHALRPKGKDCRRVIVFGAGEAGYLIIRGMLTDPASTSVPVALLDDDPDKAARTLMGIRVVGTLDDLGRVAGNVDADLLLIAIPSADSALIGRVVEKARQVGIEVRTLPTPSELASGTVTLADIRPINNNDLLGRAEVHVDYDGIQDYVRGRRILVTGAGGSIGSELCRQLHSLGPAELVMLDRDENGLHSTQLMIEGRALLDSPALVVADIRDRDRLKDVFDEHRPEVVFHAAALKHLTLLEQHPIEGVKTNVLGSRNVIDCAMACGADLVVNVSTDKAADPTSVLGASKLLAEQVAARYAGLGRGRVVSVRFGNVLGSRGSVLPTFLRQIKTGGPVTVTDPEVTRYFMSIPEAVRLVLQAGAIGRPGEIMILDMGEPVKIVELARRLINHHDPSVRIEFTGLRPGEKLNEALIAGHEEGERREHPRIFHTDGAAPDDLETVLEALADRSRIEPEELMGLATGARRRPGERTPVEAVPGLDRPGAA